MKQKLSIAAVLIMLLSLTACAPNTNHNNNSNNNDSPQSTPQNQTANYQPLTLYFPSTEEPVLVKETQETEIIVGQSMEELILQTLKKGPKGDHLVSPIPSDIRVLSVKTISGLCTVDFSDEFDDILPNDKETQNLYIQSIVHSLCELETIQQVKINIDGDQDEDIDDHLSLEQPFSPSSDVLKSK